MLATIIIIIIGTVLAIIASLYLGNLFIEIEELERRSQQMGNDEYDYGHDVNYTEEEE